MDILWQPNVILYKKKKHLASNIYLVYNYLYIPPQGLNSFCDLADEIVLWPNIAQ